MSSDTFSISKTIHGSIPRLRFEETKNYVLGKDFELSLVFIGSHLSRKLNREYRKIDKETTILTFPLSENEGEIFINPHKARREAKLRRMNGNTFILYLFIHGLLHLKGMQHSDTMEKEEERICKKFS